MRALLAAVALLASLAVVAGCKHEPETAPPPEHHHELNLPPVGPSVKVSLGGTSVDVALASLPAEGAPGSVALLQLWKAAWPAEDPAQMRFDFVGSDGFRSMSRGKCTRLLTGADLKTARLDTTTHNLLLDEGSQLPGCYRVRAVVAVEATR